VINNQGAILVSPIIGDFNKKKKERKSYATRKELHEKMEKPQWKKMKKPISK